MKKLENNLLSKIKDKDLIKYNDDKNNKIKRLKRLKRLNPTYKNIAYWLLKLDELNNKKLEKFQKISQLRLHKYLYFMWGYSFSFLYEEDSNNKKIFFPANFEAWQYGPVIKNIFINKNKKNPYDVNFLEEEFKSLKNKKIFFESQKHEDEMFKVYKFLVGLSTYKLVELSHKTDPWKNTFDNEKINEDEMKKWFSRKENSWTIIKQINKL